MIFKVSFKLSLKQWLCAVFSVVQLISLGCKNQEREREVRWEKYSKLAYAKASPAAQVMSVLSAFPGRLSLLYSSKGPSATPNSARREHLFPSCHSKFPGRLSLVTEWVTCLSLSQSSVCPTGRLLGLVRPCPYLRPVGPQQNHTV